MGKISIDLSTIKAAGIYTIEIDNSQREVTNPTSLRLLPGFNNKGPFNRPVFMQYESERQKVWGDIDNKLEQKGCFFNRMALTMLKNGPILALNLLKVDDSIDGPDQVNYATMSLDSCKANPKVVNAGKKYGEYDYQAETIDQKLYGTKKGDVIPYVGKTPYASLFDRSRFWIPSKNNLQAVAANGLITNDAGTYEHTNLLNFANTGTDEISILVFKPGNISGYDVTVKEWYGGDENIPYGWIRPSDYISDYFLRVVAVKGNWTNYPVLSNDPVWHKYFDKNGILKDKISSFCSAAGITFIGSWTGCIIPDFVDKQGNYLYLEPRVNANTESTGLLMSINEDALQVISYDKNGVDFAVGQTEIDADGNEVYVGKGSWIYDFDGNAQGESELGESEIDNSGYLVDLVGHNLQSGIYTSNYYLNLSHPKSGTAEDNDAAALVPTSYFLKAQGSLADNNAWLMSFNGRDTDTKDDDVKPEAVVRVINGTNDNWNKAFVVYDCKTNKPIKVNGEIQGVKYFYVSLTDDNNIFKTEDDILTNAIKSLSAYGLRVASVSYNENDLLVKDNNKAYTIEDILGVDEAKNQLKLVSVPVKTDTNDTYIYKNVKLFYGTYAIPEVKVKDKNGSWVDSKSPNVRLFSVIGGTKTGDYAEIRDLSTITTTTTQNVLVESEVTVRENNSVQPSATPAKGYTFSYAGNDYFMRFLTSGIGITKTEGNTLYKKVDSDTPSYFGVNFLSYNYITSNVNEAITDVYHAHYFNGYKNITESLNSPIKLVDNELYKYSVAAPVTDTNLNTFFVTNDVLASQISVGDYVNNIAFYNNNGEAEQYNLIPGVTRVITKVFVNVDARNEFYYKGHKYGIDITKISNGQLIETLSGKRGFYLFTTIDPVYISNTGYITRQLPLSSDTISHSLKFIPLKGLHITAKHRPGFDENGKIDIEGGIKKIYSMLEEDGIHRGLCHNPNMVDYRYIVDSMSFGLSSELGGKVYLSRLAQDRMKTTALLNLPSKRQFELSVNPCFCESYDLNTYTKPPFNTKFIPQGGNNDMYSTTVFTLPTEESGSKFAAAFWPHLVYYVNGREILVPPAADVCDVLIRKFQGGDPYVIAANRNGIIKNKQVIRVEFPADVTDREYLEPWGANTIIQEGNNIVIYGNQTCYQDTKSDFNKLHVRENLNTLEIACEAVLKNYNFLYNTPAVRASVVTALTPILETMKLSQAIEKYEIICDESNNTPDIIAEDYGIVDIVVWMSHGMEKIVQRITLNRKDTMND